MEGVVEGLSDVLQLSPGSQDPHLIMSNALPNACHLPVYFLHFPL